MVAAPTPKRFTVAEYEQLGRLGFFHEDDRIELLDGEIIEMAAVGGDHAAIVAQLTRVTVRQVGDDVIVHVQNPIRLNDGTMPQPDLAIVWDKAYDGALPSAADTLLVMEVSDTSLDYDRNKKFPRYAAAGIPEAWLFEVTAGRAERHSEPRDGRYQQIAIAHSGQALASTVLSSLTISVERVFR